MDLIVCVGESCHLNGAEIVLKTFQDQIEATGFGDRVTLKGSFCIGECDDGDRVSFRLGDRIFSTGHKDAAYTFQELIAPELAATGAATAHTRNGSS